MEAGSPHLDSIRRLIAAYSERELAAMVLGGIAVAGAMVGYLTFLLPHPANTDFVTPAIAFAASLTAGIVLWRRRATVGWRGIAIVTALGSAVITVAMLSVPDRTGAYAGYYVWIGMFSFYFLRPRVAILQIAWVGALYGYAVAVDAPSGAVEQWLNGVATTLGVGLIVLALRVRISGLVASLEAAALTDELTGLPNRRSFGIQLERELQRSIRADQELAIAMLDLDRFKALNDRAGHLEGDEALRRLAGVIRQQIRGMDWAARLAGDEFAILLPGADADQAAEVAGRVRDGVRDEFREEGAPLRASLGVSVRGGRDITAKGLLDEADLALYVAKRGGGDTIALAPDAAIEARQQLLTA